jgi:hypothetical protein
VSNDRAGFRRGVANDLYWRETVEAADLESHVSSLEIVLSVRFPHQNASPVARAIREIYATRSAASILLCARALFTGAVAIEPERALAQAPSSMRPPLPSLEAVRAARPKLLGAVAVGREDETATALREMGVVGLCPPPEEQCRRLEFSVGSVVGRPRLIPLVELAVLAADLGVYHRAKTHVEEAWCLSPRPRNLHDLHTVAGTISLRVGDLAKAREHLAESIRVCREDGWARLTCMVRAPRLMLAEKLLEHGEGAAVVSYLEKCLDVWDYSWSPIPAWIAAIKRGQNPDFAAPGPLTAMEHPRLAMPILVAEADFLAETGEADTKEGNPYAGRSLDEILAELQGETDAAVRGKLRRGRN